MSDCDESYGDARRRFWEAAYVSALSHNTLEYAKQAADKALLVWESTWVKDPPCAICGETKTTPGTVHVCYGPKQATTGLSFCGQCGQDITDMVHTNDVCPGKAMEKFCIDVCDRPAMRLSTTVALEKLIQLAITLDRKARVL